MAKVHKNMALIQKGHSRLGAIDYIDNVVSIGMKSSVTIIFLVVSLMMAIQTVPT